MEVIEYLNPKRLSKPFGEDLSDEFGKNNVTSKHKYKKLKSAILKT